MGEEGRRGEGRRGGRIVRVGEGRGIKGEGVRGEGIGFFWW